MGIDTGVEKTSLAIALVRAAESERADRLFDDPFAERFLDAAPDVFAAEIEAARTGTVSAWGRAYRNSVVLRTRYFDDYLQQAVADGVEQVVLLGAGLDSRAFRLPWPPTVIVYEVDLPGVLTFKDTVLAGSGVRSLVRRVVVPADVTGDWTTPLVRAGLDPRRPVAWLTEGLLLYLDESQTAALLRAMGTLSAPDSRFSVGVEPPAERARRTELESLADLDEYRPMWRGGRLGVDDWLRRHGWQLRLFDRATLSTRYGRPELAGPGHFLHATRQGESDVP